MLHIELAHVLDWSLFWWGFCTTGLPTIPGTRSIDYLKQVDPLLGVFLPELFPDNSVVEANTGANDGSEWKESCMACYTGPKGAGAVSNFGFY